MALHIHRAERADTLADALARELAVPCADPFAAELVAVAAPGVQRWLTQRLASVLGGVDGDGVAANIDFPAPAALVAGVLGAATGIDPGSDPWAPERVVWSVLRVIDEVLTEPWGAVLARHLGAHPATGPADGYRAGRRYGTAARITELFDGYGAQRPELILAWAAGADTDGCGRALPTDLAWQPRLWRRLRTELGVPAPAERLARACHRLREDPTTTDLPPRISVFTPGRPTTDQLAVLDALGAGREVHLWVVHPSPVLWDAMAPQPPVSPLPARSAADSALRPAHPLLAALGRDGRELRRRLGTFETATEVYHPGPPRTRAPTLLSELQAAIRADRWPPRPDPALADGTVAVHSCHGPARQVEVLRDALLGLFAADPTLQPRDVVVLCPDLETFGPLVRATFGQYQGDDSGHPVPPAHGLRVRLADRAPGAGNPVLTVLTGLLGLADGRVTVTQILDLAAAEPVRQRCGFDDDDIERLREWAAETGARWGIGQRQRQTFGLGDFAQNTLNAAVDRILLGVAAGESGSDWLDLALPLEDVDSGDVDLAGRFAEFTDRLAVCVRDLCGSTPAEPAGSPRPGSHWLRVLGRALDLLTDVGRAQAWQAAEARRELSAALEYAGTVPLRLPDVAALLHGRLAGRPGRANFRTGELTVCTLLPLRSVPHRVVVLLGLDDEVFPRATAADGDDVLARNPLIGERDARGEDRQLLLDAITAAGERLLILHTGADPVTGAYRPPAVPLAELLDVLAAQLGRDRNAPPPSGDPVLIRHPLQAFDPRNFDPVRPFGFDTVALAGARAAAAPQRPPAPFLPGPLPAAARADIELAELVSFAEHPIRAFLWQRLGIRVPEPDEEIDERLPIELDGLVKWNMGERMLAARLTGADPGDLRAAEWRRGTLPPFGLGAAVLDEVESTVERLVRVARPLREVPARAVDIAVDLGAGRHIGGTVADVHDDTLIRVTFSRLAPKHRIGAWVRLLALAASERHQGWRAITIGRGRFGRPAWQSTLTAPNGVAAREILAGLVTLRDDGLAEPLPITPVASATYAERRGRGASIDDARLAADHEFLGGPNGPKPFGDHADRYLRYVWGAVPGLDGLDSVLPASDPAGEDTRFGALARRLWNPLLACESQEQP